MKEHVQRKKRETERKENAQRIEGFISKKQKQNKNVSRLKVVRREENNKHDMFRIINNGNVAFAPNSRLSC